MQPFLITNNLAIYILHPCRLLKSTTLLSKGNAAINILLLVHTGPLILLILHATRISCIPEK